MLGKMSRLATNVLSSTNLLSFRWGSPETLSELCLVNVDVAELVCDFGLTHALYDEQVEAYDILAKWFDRPLEYNATLDAIQAAYRFYERINYPHVYKSPYRDLEF